MRSILLIAYGLLIFTFIIFPENFSTGKRIGILFFSIFIIFFVRYSLGFPITFYENGFDLPAHGFRNSEGIAKKSVYAEYNQIKSIFIFSGTTILSRKHPVGIIFTQQCKYLKYCPCGYLLFDDNLGTEFLSEFKKIIGEEKYNELVITISDEFSWGKIIRFLDNNFTTNS